jgi:hypothetical protein
MADADDATRRLDELETLAREYRVVPAFRWPDDDQEEVEACFVRLRSGEAGGDGLMVLEIGAVDGSWTEDYLVGARHFESAASATPAFDGPDETFPPDSGD